MAPNEDVKPQASMSTHLNRLLRPLKILKPLTRKRVNRFANKIGENYRNVIATVENSKLPQLSYLKGRIYIYRERERDMYMFVYIETETEAIKNEEP